jgi:hypothetical protein
MIRLALALAWITAVACPDDAKDVALVNPGFEEGWSDAPADPAGKVAGRMAKGWSDNSSWADVRVTYGVETGNPHRGQSAQRITLHRIGSGAVQFTQGATFRKGRAYAFSVWMRGRPGTAVSLMLRRQGAPYTTYAASDVVLSPEWREFTAEGPVPEDAEGLLLLRLTAPAEIVVDDARLVDLTDASANAAPQRGNLVSGGSFEAGLPFGWSTRVGGTPSAGVPDPRPVVDDTASKEGRRSYRMDLPAETELELHGPILRLNVGRAHAASLWVKASRPDVYVHAELERTPLAAGTSIGTQWQRLVLKGVVPYLRWTRLRLRAAAGSEPLKVWVDAVQVEEAAEPSDAYSPRSPHEVVLRLNRPGSIVFEDEPADATLAVVPPAPEGARLKLRMVDLAGAATDLPALALPAAKVPLPASARGVFKLSAEVVSNDGKSLSSPVELVWSRLPRPREIEPSTSFFGVHIPVEPDYVALARASGHRWTRVHDTSMFTKWAAAEPAPGTWRFYDRQAAAAREGGMAVLGMLDGAPRWMSTKPREGGYWGHWNLPDKPEARKGWEAYVRAVVGHYRGTIEAWEVWNEPWGDWFSGAGGTPSLYAELLRIAYRTAKEANPGATVVGVDTYRGHEAWHDAVLAEAKLDSFDAFSFHDYNDALYGGKAPLARVQADAFNAAQARFGTPKPLWNTEGGALALASMYSPETGGMPLRTQPAQGVRYDVTMMAAGVRAFFFYAAHSDPPMGNPEGALEWDRAVKPILAGRAVLASLVDGAGVPVRREPVPGVDLYAYPARAGVSVQVLWSYDGDAHQVRVESGSKVLDVFGNPLGVGPDVTVTIEPVYVIVPSR